MKKVTGTSSAIAIVAVRPGTAPTKRPKIEAAIITAMVCQLNTMPNASRTGSIGFGPQNAYDFSTPQGSGTRSSL